jgi:hypothetical protein
MAPLDFISVEEAARELEVNGSRVRAMLQSGGLDGDKIGGRWLVAGESVRRRQREGYERGRQFSPGNAWALLFLASGLKPPGDLARWERSRLLHLLDDRGLDGLQGRLRHRASVQAFSAHPGVLRHLATDNRLVLSGVSGASAHGLGLSAGQELDAYVRASDLDRLVSEFALAPADGGLANLKLREVPDNAWSFDKPVAPLAAVALDLAQEPDKRSVRIGLRRLRQLDHQHRWRRVEN